MATKKPERRVFPIQFRQEEGEKPKLEGHAAVFNQPIELYNDFIEVIAPGAFKNSIENKDDVRALFNHDPNFVLGRSSAGTLALSEDKVGLFTVIDPPDTQWAKDLMKSIERGDINQMSFGFYIVADREETIDGKRVCTITEVELFDVSPVTFPAYPSTDVGLRKLSNGMEYKTAKSGTTVNVHIEGNVVDEKEFIEKHLASKLARAVSRGVSGHEADNDRQDQAGSNGTNEAGKPDKVDKVDKADSDKAKRAGRSASRKRKLDLADKLNRQEEKLLG